MFDQSGTVTYDGQALSFPHHVTVYWVINTSKASPNRCVPHNVFTAAELNTTLSNKSVPANPVDPASPWNDGCDFSIVSSTSGVPPVVNVDYTTTYPTGGAFYDSSSGNRIRNFQASGFQAFPGDETLDNHTSGTKFTTVQYKGAPFVISSADAPYVMALIRHGDNVSGTLIDVQDEVKRFGSDKQRSDTGNHWYKPAVVGSTAISQVCNGNSPDAALHYVFMHESTQAFTVSNAKRMSKTPPKIALLDTGPGVKWTANNAGAAYHSSEDSLNIYLQNAGLWVSGSGNGTDSAGCPPNSNSGCALNGSTAGVGQTKKTGLIYDQFNAYQDLASTSSFPDGLLNRKDLYNRPLYQVFWAPHWDMNPAYSAYNLHRDSFTYVFDGSAAGFVASNAWYWGLGKHLVQRQQRRVLDGDQHARRQQRHLVQGQLGQQHGVGAPDHLLKWRQLELHQQHG
jgi:hypothetical protein